MTLIMARTSATVGMTVGNVTMIGNHHHDGPGERRREAKGTCLCQHRSEGHRLRAVAQCIGFFLLDQIYHSFASLLIERLQSLGLRS